MSHKSCNNSTTGWRATFRSLDDFHVPVKQCRFKVYLDNLEFSFRKQIVVKPTNSYKSNFYNDIDNDIAIAERGRRLTRSVTEFLKSADPSRRVRPCRACCRQFAADAQAKQDT